MTLKTMDLHDTLTRLFDENGIDAILRTLAKICREEGESAITRLGGTVYAYQVNALCKRNAARIDAANYGDAEAFLATCERAEDQP